MILLISSMSLLANVKPARIWATATFNKSEVLVGEPLVVTVTVYTSTWFTQPPVFSEIQVKGALMVRLESRTGAKSVTIGRQQYPAITQQFVVYPSIIGTNTLPSFEVKTECPPEGGYKGIERIIHTKERSFEVKGPPAGTDTANWMTAYDLRLTESWDKPLDNLKAGDIIERRIRIEASGTLSAAIAPPHIAEVEFGSIYNQPPQLTNKQARGSFNGTRTDIIRYLLEKDGQFEIPELTVSYFSMKDQTLHSESLAAISLDIAPNPDLEFILSQQELLQQELAKENEVDEQVAEAWSYLGLNAWQWTLIVAAGLALIYLLVRWLRRLQIKLDKRKKVYQDSEKYHFKLLEEAAKKGEARAFIRQLGFWFDRYRTAAKVEYLRALAQADPKDKLTEQLDSLADKSYREDRLDDQLNNGSDMVEGIRRSKQNHAKRKKESDERYWKNLNP